MALKEIFRLSSVLILIIYAHAVGLAQNQSEHHKELDLRMLSNARFHTYAFEETVQLINGIYYYRDDKKVIDSASFTKLDEKHIAFGDLNKDGKLDAAVILISDGGCA